MQWLQGYPFYLLMGSVFGFFLSAISYPQRHLPGRRYIWILMLSGSLMILTTVLELMTESFQAKLWWRNIQQIPLFFCALLAYAVAVDYTGKLPERMTRRLFLLSLPIVLYLLLIFTDSYHHLMRREVGLETFGGLGGITVQPTPLSTMLMAYDQMFGLWAVFLLAAKWRNTPRHYKRQHFLLMTGLSLPIVSVFLLPALQLNVIGFIALVFIPSGLILYYALHRNPFFTIWPVDKDKILESMKDGIVLTDRSGTIVDLNTSASVMLDGLTRESCDSWIGRNIRSYLRHLPKLLSVFALGKEGKLEVEPDGESGKHYRITLIPINRNSRLHAGTLLVISDITDEKNVQKKLIYQANVDGLTGIYNRRHFLENVEERLKKAPSGVSLLLFDIDDFKQINDRYGHTAGDRVLVRLSKILKETYAGIGVVGRIGGEEFAVFLSGLNVQESLDAAERLREIIEDTRISPDEGGEVFVTISIGISFSQKDDITFEELYQNADAALYHSKEKGKNRVTLGLEA